MTNQDGLERQAASIDCPGARRRPGIARIAQSPRVWLACSGIFVANAVLSAVQAQWLLSALGLVTGGLAVVAALASSHSRRLSEESME
jgi:hypothetical protein